MDKRIDLTNSDARLRPKPESAASLPQPSREPSTFRKALRGIGWLFGGPADWFDRRSIAQGATLIRALLLVLRSKPRHDPRFRTGEAGAFDVRATAFGYGVTPNALETRLRARRRQTALLAYGSFGVGCAFLLAWLWQALGMTWSAARLVSALEFLPCCALFYLFGFYNALLNFQIRTGRLASWREYLMTNDAFLPR